MADPISNGSLPTSQSSLPAQAVQAERLQRVEPETRLRPEQRAQESQEPEQSENRRQPDPDDRLGTQVDTQA